MTPHLEHLNITVPDLTATADMLVQVFGWQIRWEGPSKNNGRSIHVGGEGSYLALYSPGTPLRDAENTYERTHGLNHIGVVVDDIDAVEVRVKALGLEPHSHGDYEPGRRFYFDDAHGLEVEVVQY